MTGSLPLGLLLVSGIQVPFVERDAINPEQVANICPEHLTTSYSSSDFEPAPDNASA